MRVRNSGKMERSYASQKKRSLPLWGEEGKRKKRLKREDPSAVWHQKKRKKRERGQSCPREKGGGSQLKESSARSDATPEEGREQFLLCRESWKEREGKGGRRAEQRSGRSGRRADGSRKGVPPPSSFFRRKGEEGKGKRGTRSRRRREMCSVTNPTGRPPRKGKATIEHLHYDLEREKKEKRRKKGRWTSARGDRKDAVQHSFEVAPT